MNLKQTFSHFVLVIEFVSTYVRTVYIVCVVSIGLRRRCRGFVSPGMTQDTTSLEEDLSAGERERETCPPLPTYHELLDNL